AAFISFNRIKVKFSIGVSGNPVATTFGTSKTSYLGPNFDVPYYDVSRNVIARIISMSNFNYGCTQLTIDRDTTGGAKPFWDNSPSHYVMAKTFLVTPNTNNASGQYQITLFFTAQEKARWEAITGN